MKAMSTVKKRFGDRRDATLVRDADSMHFIMGVIYPNRADNEAYISECIKLDAINQYLEQKNAAETEFRYTMFHLIVTALLRTVTQRPKMNRFYANQNLYMRDDVSAAFVVKKQFADDGGEGVVVLHAKEDDTLESVHDYIKKVVTQSRSADRANQTEEDMNLFNKMPRWLGKAAVRLVRWLERHGWAPKDMVSDDPGQATVFLSNLGSIKLKCGYHHLSNWGTNSVFVVIGEKHWQPFYDREGNVTMHEVVDLGLTVDERIADGYYYAKTVRMLKYLLEHPEELEKPLKEAVDFEEK